MRFWGCAGWVSLLAVWTVVGQEDFNSRIRYIPLDEKAEFTQSLNGTWKFMLNGPKEAFFKPGFDDTGWSAITVPGNWEVQGFAEPSYRTPTQAEGLYRRTFTVPSEWAGRRVLIRFEGVAFGFEFWIDGQRAGCFSSAYNRSDFDITGWVKPGQTQTLSVRAYVNPKGWEFDTNDDWSLSGIHHDVLLFSVPDTHVGDLTVVTDVARDGAQGTVTCRVDVERLGTDAHDASVALELHAPDGTSVGKEVRSVDKDGRVSAVFQVDHPLLWNAEAPHLYTLNVALAEEGRILHSFSQKVGIRVVTIEDRVLKVNGTPIKMRGVCRHDLWPDTGRAPRLEQYLEDIVLMKRGNINAIRFSHYPSQKLFVDLCDQYGFYVIDEVPFGRGDDHLADDSYLPILRKRAEATLNRDKNNPCVIIWSIGNENPTPDNVVKVVAQVRDQDSTRPRLLPHPTDQKWGAPLPEGCTILSTHYPFATRSLPGRKSLVQYATDPSVTTPVVATEYSHSRYDLFEGHGARWDVIQHYPQLGGGFIWHFQDQGVWRKLTDELAKKLEAERSFYAYPVRADGTFADSNWSNGTEGIVYADRFPSADYFLNRKVYAQILIPMTNRVSTPGLQTVTLPVLNRYDFTALNRLSGVWRLLVDGREVQQGKVALDAVPPQGTGTITVAIRLPDDMRVRENVLRLEFTDWNGNPVYEQAVHLVPPEGRPQFEERLTDMKKAPVVKSNTGDTESVTCGKLTVTFDWARATVSARMEGAQRPFMESPIVRIGRVLRPEELSQYKRNKWPLRDQALLTSRKVVGHVTRSEPDGAVSVTMDIIYPLSDEGEDAAKTVAAKLTYRIAPEGWVDVDYTLTPEKITEYLAEFGLAFELPKEQNAWAWVGNGLYPSYPGQTEAEERGVARVAPLPETDPQSRYYKGNRTGVDLAAVTDAERNGMGVLCDQSTCSLEAVGDEMVFSQILRCTGKGSKSGGIVTAYRLKADEIGAVRGHLRVVPLADGQWPQVFTDLLGGR